MKSYVYEIKHIPTNSFYVGSRVSNKKETILEYCGSSTSELFSKERINSKVSEYQKTILKTFDTKTGAYDYENGDKGLIKQYIDKHGKKCFNKSYFNHKGKQRFSSIGLDLSGENNGMFGKNHSKETMEFFKQMNAGRKHTEETKQKMSLKKSGSNNPNFGKNHSDETKDLISKKLSGVKATKETKQKMSSAAKEKITCKICGYTSIRSWVSRKCGLNGEKH